MPRTTESMCCLLCDAHVPTGEQLMVWRGRAYGSNHDFAPQSIEGVMCVDSFSCIQRAIARAASDSHVKTPHQRALRDQFGPPTQVLTDLDIALAKLSGLIEGITGVRTRLKNPWAPPGTIHLASS